MESNKDEALKCLAIAQKHRNAGNYPSAKRFCQKSLSLFSTAEAVKLLEVIEAEAKDADASGSESQQTGASASTSAAETHPSAAGARHRHTQSTANGDASDAKPSQKSYTPENLAVVNRVRACKVTDYYEILSLKRDCEEGAVKKAYRKVRSL